MLVPFSSGNKRPRMGVLAAVAALALVQATPTFAQTDDDFFKGKQLTMIVSSAPGGG